MDHSAAARYGSWRSPITAELYASSFVGVNELALDGDRLYWKETRTKEGGRQVIMRLGDDGSAVEVTPKEFNVRTTVHEYGGGDYFVSGGTSYFSNFKDQRIYAHDPDGQPTPVTPAGVNVRFADGVFDAKRDRLIFVREDHTMADQQATNSVVAIDLASPDTGRVLASGNDFYSNPRLDPENARLAWLTWNHPNMPWDGTELWVGELSPDGFVSGKKMVAGGPEESIFQPEWSPDGSLYFVSDRTGWWNLYRWKDGGVRALHEMQAEFGVPQWLFRERAYAVASPRTIVCSYVIKGKAHIATVDTETGDMREIPLPYSDTFDILALGDVAYLIVGSPMLPVSLVRLDLKTHEASLLRRSRPESIDPGYLSTPETIEFPTENGKTAFAFYYPPKNKDCEAPTGELPPLLVMSHGGPTGSTGTTLRYSIQFWTSRGIAVVDVDYGGSTGYGREYRKRLDGNWGIVDLDDCVNAARYLVDSKRVDGKRLAITGGSAGGYTTLCAVTFRKVFNAGASYFGISDMEALMTDTHKFESHYGDRMVGPYPERRDLYQERSPINYVEQISCPIILFQGLEDKVVPPDQSRKFYEAVKKKGLPTAYVPFEGEQHGFRKAENISRSIELELYFYSRVLGIEPGDTIEPIPIDNISN